MDKTYNINDKAFYIASLAVQAVLYEVSSYPSPGLVSAVSSGAHTDMDYFTFIDSTSALIKTFTLCAQAGFTDKSPKEIFKDIREIGKIGEKEMLQKTKGINTHKGMLFLMGISCAAVAYSIQNGLKFENIREVIMNMTEGIVEKELIILKDKHTDKLTHGERIFLEYGAAGVRGEAEKGLPIIFDYALEEFKNGEELSLNDRLIQTLIGIMQFCEDSTILYRHSMETLKQVQVKAKEIMKLGGMKTEEGKIRILSLDEEFKKLRISPGGSADLLAVTVFFKQIEGIQK